MKKLGFLAVLLSVTAFSLGCQKSTEPTAPTTNGGDTTMTDDAGSGNGHADETAPADTEPAPADETAPQ